MDSQAQAWHGELNRLLARLSAVRVASDIESMDLSEQRGVYCPLRRLLGEAQRGGDE